MARFNITTKDLLDNDPSKIASEISKFTPGGMTTTRSQGEGRIMNLNMFNLSEILMRIPAYDSEANTLARFESQVTGALGGVFGEMDEETGDTMAKLLPGDLRNMFSAVESADVSGEPPDESASGGGSSGGGRIEGDDEQLSPSFNLSEFRTKDGPGGALKTWPPPASVPALRWLCVNVLEPMRDRFGAARINSAYRHLSYNRGVGSSDGSHHIYDNHPNSPAVDVRFATGSSRVWADAARDIMGGGGTGIYSGGHVHIDNRSTAARWHG